MDDIKKEVRKHDLLGRWRSLEERWDLFSSATAIYVENGIEDDDVKKLKTVALQNWLLRFESVNSLLVITRTTLLFFAAPDYIELYSPFIAQAKAQNKEIILVARQEKAADGKLNATAFFEELKRLKVSTVGVLSMDKHKGRLVETARELLAQTGLPTVDVSRNVQELLSRKDQIELDLIDKCAQVTAFFFEKFVQSVENLLEQSKRESQVAVSKHLDDLLAKSRKKISADFGVNPAFYDFSYAPVVQSGGKYDLKPTVESRDEPLQQDCILLNLGGKYCELNSNIYRTLMINPGEEEKRAYAALEALHRHVIAALAPGRRLGEVHAAGVAFVAEKFPQFVDKLPAAFGFGIGYEFRESCLAIKADNDRAVAPGQVYAVITSLKGLRGFGDIDYCLQLSDTVLLPLAGGQQVPTARVPTKLEDVAYKFDEEKPAAETKPDRRKPQAIEVDGGPRDRANRRKEIKQDQERQQKMREHQRQLLLQKDEELRERLLSGDFNFRATETTKVVLEKIQTYTAETFPQGYNPRLIAVDAKHSAVLLPINNALVPFHVSCLKNVTRHQDAKNYSLRFNFHTPGISSSLVFPTAASFGADPIFVKELFFRSANVDALNQSLRLIKELQKRQKLSLALSKEVKEERVTLHNKLKALSDLKMRPPLAGKKTVGSLTAFANGFRFQSKRNETLELALSNVKHAIFQQCDDNMIVILHFALQRPIVVNKKMTQHVQFYTEVGYTSEDLNDNRRKNRGSEREEFEEEELEERAREHYNALFLDFVSAVERGWESPLRFDSPFPDLGFHGSSSYNNVFIMPTAYCLVSLVETPFLFVVLDDIELVSIERVDNKIKNFDLIIIFKDYATPVQSIRNIPKTQLETIKKWLDDQSIIFLEGGTMNLKWDELLKKIRGNPEEFVLKEGGWQAFFDEDEESASDQNFDAEEEKEESAYEQSEGDDDDEDLSESELYEDEEELESEQADKEEDDDFDEEDFSEEESVKKRPRPKQRKGKA